MSHCPEELKYAASHEWVRVNSDGTVTIGISDHAQEALGDLVYVEVPEVDSHLGASDPFGVVESVKAASDVYAPISGTVVEVNEALEDGPELVNDSAYDEGWLIRLQPDDVTEIDTLMDAAAYAEAIAD
jgi:glycine cleavage system H protein